MSTNYGRDSVNTFENEKCVEVVILRERRRAGAIVFWFTRYWEESERYEKKNGQEIATLDAIDDGFADFCPWKIEGGEDDGGNKSEEGNRKNFDWFGNGNWLTGFRTKKGEDD